MVKGLKINLKIAQTGFALVEVMIALLIFSVFAVSIISIQSSNVTSSAILAEDLALHNLAELKMNEVLISRLKFTNATENDPDTGEIEVEGYENYKYTIEYKKMLLPDLSAIMGKSEDDNPYEEDSGSKRLEKMVFEKLKKNIEGVLWQVKVIITNSLTGEEYELNAWVENKDAKLDTNFGL